MILFNFPALKKLSSIILIFIYLITISGASLSIHHCMGRTSFTLLGITINKTCKCTHQSEKHSSKCCDNKKVVIKNTGDNFSPKESIEIKPTSFKSISVKYQLFAISFLCEEFFKPYYNIKAPPDISSHHLYIKNRVILI